jgi:hypothetical protein
MLPFRDAVPVSAAALPAQIPLRRSIISTSNQARLKGLRRALSPTFPAGEMVFFIPWRLVAEESGAAHYGFGGAMLLDLLGPRSGCWPHQDTRVTLLRLGDGFAGEHGGLMGLRTRSSRAVRRDHRHRQRWPTARPQCGPTQGV